MRHTQHRAQHNLHVYIEYPYELALLSTSCSQSLNSA